LALPLVSTWLAARFKHPPDDLRTQRPVAHQDFNDLPRDERLVA
jgi:hypothetical protein